jgi:hypothetical protein
MKTAACVGPPFKSNPPITSFCDHAITFSDSRIPVNRHRLFMELTTMASRDDLSLTDGIADANVRIAAIFPTTDGVDVEMEMYNTRTDHVFGTLKYRLGQAVGEPLISVLADAHHETSLVLRQLLFLNDGKRRVYEKELAEHYSTSCR